MSESGHRRMLVTVMFTDIADSTANASRLGDDRWIQALNDHDALVRHAIASCRGSVVNTTGDGFVAMFKAPLDGVRCARQIVVGALELGLRVRAGLHTGEVERRGRDISGIAVATAARIAEQADGAEVLLSSTVRDLVAGTDVRTTQGHRITLRGLPGRRTLHRLLLDDQAEATVRRGTSPASRSSVRRGASRTPAQAATRRTAPRKERVRVLLVDDHPLWRQTLGRVLQGAGMTVVGEECDADSAVQAAGRLHPDVVIMDLELPGKSGVVATAEMLGNQPQLSVLFLSSSDDPSHVLSALGNGARGYLVKTAGAAEIATAVERIAGGELVVPPQLSNVVLSQLRQPAERSHSPEPVSNGHALTGLSQRELGVLQLVAEGMSNQAIATKLHLTVKTVEGHMSNIFSKLRLETDSGEHRRVRAATIYRTHALTAAHDR